MKCLLQFLAAFKSDYKKMVFRGRLIIPLIPIFGQIDRLSGIPVNLAGL